MLFSWLSELKSNTTHEEFKEILKMASDDIKFNRTSFKKCTNAKKFIEIAERCRKVVCA
nr:hypothetical protein [uncultured Clostridium sp.]